MSWWPEFRKYEKTMNPKVDHYFAEGCGRCALGGTPACKVHNWPREMRQLRLLLLDCGLTEEVKWDVPCYTYQKSNVVILAAFKEYCAVSFFKGALLSDTEGILVKPGENTKAGRMIRFTDVAQIVQLEDTLRAYIFEAIEVEKAGLKVPSIPASALPIPAELQAQFDEDPAFHAAFKALTQGRQRGYLQHFSGAKQSATRTARIEKCRPMIFMGKGMGD
jgi:uncharacterized protein YdeI (YjbR/CyaY-like superfamily)